MNIIQYKQLNSLENEGIVRKVISQKGVIVYPTDTLYGLGGHFYAPEVSRAIDGIKHRTDMPYSVMVSGLDMLKPLVDFIPDIFYHLHDQFLPGKFTFLFNVSPGLDPVLVKGSPKIGIRIPDVPGMLRLIDHLDTPLLSTSVNRSGDAPLNDPAAIVSHFGNDPAIQLLIDNGPLPASAGSTILDLTRSPITCIRKGDPAVYKLAEHLLQG